MLRIAQTASKVEKTNIHSYTLDISCFDAIQLCHPGGLLYTPERDLFGGLSVILPKTATVSNLSSYLNIHSFVDTVMSYPAIENARPLAILNK